MTEQNFLSANVTEVILREIRPVFVFSGHDHYGCDFVHPTKTTEHTVRSMMGDFSGNSALFEISRGPTEFKYHFGTCPFIRIQLISVLVITAMGSFALWIITTILLCSYRNHVVPPGIPSKDHVNPEPVTLSPAPSAGPRSHVN